MKWPLILIIILVIPTAFATYEICGDIVNPNTNCTMVTPVISCTNYTYQITNTSGSVITTGNMTLFEGQKYHFNFTEGPGRYVVTLCDDTTREVFVEDSTKMWVVGVSILMFMLVMGSFAFAWMFGKSENQYIRALKIVFFALGLGVILLGIRMIGIFAEDFGGSANMIIMTNTLWRLAVPIALGILGFMIIGYLADLFKLWQGLIEDVKKYFERRKEW